MSDYNESESGTNLREMLGLGVGCGVGLAAIGTICYFSVEVIITKDMAPEQAALYLSLALLLLAIYGWENYKSDREAKENNLEE